MKRRTAFKCAGADPRLKDAVQRANNDWLIAMQTGDAAAIAAPYMDHAVFTFPDGSSIVGREAIQGMYRSRFEKKGLAVATTIDSRSVEQDGDLAYEWGSATIQLHGQGPSAAAGGRYLTVWQRQPAGDWKISRNLVFPAEQAA